MKCVLSLRKVRLLSISIYFSDVCVKIVCVNPDVASLKSNSHLFCNLLSLIILKILGSLVHFILGMYWSFSLPISTVVVCFVFTS